MHCLRCRPSLSSEVPWVRFFLIVPKPGSSVHRLVQQGSRRAAQGGLFDGAHRRVGHGRIRSPHVHGRAAFADQRTGTCACTRRRYFSLSTLVLDLFVPVFINWYVSWLHSCAYKAFGVEFLMSCAEGPGQKVPVLLLKHLYMMISDIGDGYSFGAPDGLSEDSK